jgi:hypothetical protein
MPVSSHLLHPLVLIVSISSQKDLPTVLHESSPARNRQPAPELGIKDQGLSVPHRHVADSNLRLLLASMLNHEHDDSGKPDIRDGVVLMLSTSAITFSISDLNMWQKYQPAHWFLVNDPSNQKSPHAP